ncbi:enoyl-CoA hydratase-related protein [Rhodococcus sp. 5G237]
MTAQLHYQDKVAVLHLGDGENRFTPQWIDTVDTLLDEVMREGVQGLITTADGKFYSYGLDLDWLTAHKSQREWYFERAQQLFARILTLPLPTVAAVNGHAFGAGAMLALSHDYRIMRADRGFYCFPEVDVQVPFTSGMAALIQAKLTPQAAITAMTTGYRYGGIEARENGLLDRTVDEASLVDSALELIRPIIGKDTSTLGAIKSTMFASVVDALVR